ncbi:MAG: restriction endonuclease subunit S [Dysgonamonadaceae bacterium]|jgi:restriction endonuclease S subunit|nr:restriction endonuclease subunit S [Dysgonamonadaceae bacterium]
MNIDKSNWKRVRFGDVAIQQKECIDTNTTELNRYIAGEHMNTDDIHLRKWGTVGDGYLGPAFMRKFEKGNILYGSRRTYLKKVAVADFDGITANTTFVIKANDKIINPILLPFLMLSDNFTKHSIENSKGSVNPYINWKDIANYEFLLPPKEEQPQLAELLWAADEVVEREKEVLKNIDIYQKTYMNQKFEDSKQTIISFSELLIINPVYKKELDKDRSASFISMADVSNEGMIINKEDKQIKELERKGLTPFIENDILFAKITPCMENGKGAIATNLTNGIGFGSTDFHVLRAKNNSDIKFCFYLSKMDSFRQLAGRLMTGSAGQKRVQPEFFKQYKFHAPKTENRYEIGEKMDLLENRKINIKKQIESSQQLKSVLINKIF